MSSSAQHVFNQTASGYDHQRSRLIPGFDDFYRWAVDLIPASAARIVDLGAGTGLLSALVLERFPHAHLHLIDQSESMLAQARTRFTGQPHITFELADYASCPLPDSSDAVVSALSIHHLDDEAKRLLFRRIARALRPGGIFVNADQVLGPTPALERQYRETWLHQVRALGASEPQIEQSLFRQQADRCSSVEDQLRWMRDSLTEVDCWFKHGRFAVMSGVRA